MHARCGPSGRTNPKTTAGTRRCWRNWGTAIPDCCHRSGTAVTVPGVGPGTQKADLRIALRQILDLLIQPPNLYRQARCIMVSDTDERALLSKARPRLGPSPWSQSPEHEMSMNPGKLLHSTPAVSRKMITV